MHLLADDEGSKQREHGVIGWYELPSLVVPMCWHIGNDFPRHSSHVIRMEPQYDVGVQGATCLDFIAHKVVLHTTQQSRLRLAVMLRQNDVSG